MNKVLKNLLYVGLVLFFFMIFSAPARAEVMAPKIVKLTGGQNFSLAGTTPLNSEVLIYLDGNFVGRAETAASTGAEITFNYLYTLKNKLADGRHAVMAVAQDKISLVLSAPSNEVKFSINALPAPTLIAPSGDLILGDSRPLIIGLAKNDTSVKIFIDDVFNGQTAILSHDSGTANFAYRPPVNLALGWHKIYLIAEDREGKTSPATLVLNFKIELPFPAPTMLRPVVNSSTVGARPFIVGLAKNDSKIKIYLDGKLEAEFAVINHLSGTANFAYKPAKALNRGGHSVYALAIDQRGKASKKSNTVNFPIRISAIAQSAEEKSGQAEANIEGSATVEPAKPGAGVIPEASGGVEKEPKTGSVMEGAKGLIAKGAKRAANGWGIINENEQNQSGLKLDLILFILFLVSVIAWLLWVNRELVKERRERNQARETLKSEKSGADDSQLDERQNKLL